MLSPGPPNGDLSLGLEGWTLEGRDPPLLLAPGARLVGNPTLVSPPLAIPVTAQTLRITARAKGSGGLLAVRARPEDGSAEVPLGMLELGARRRSWPVGAAAVAGRTVRVVLDPVPALGTSVDILRVGPVTSSLAGWAVERGALEVKGARGRRTVRVGDEPLILRSPTYRATAAPRRRTVSVEVRGDGVVRVAAAGRRAARRAGAAWRRVEIVLPRRSRVALALRVVAAPGPGGLELRRLGALRFRSPGRSGA